MSHGLARLTRGQYLGLLALVAAIGLVPQFLSRTLPDISFLLYAAGRVLDGATLYVDLIEINPPLIVWLKLPVVWFARHIGIQEILVYRLVLTILLAVVTVWCWRILKRLERQGAIESAGDRRFVLLLIVFALFALPRLDWGEREHLTVALILPYILLGAGHFASGASASIIVREPGAGPVGVAAALGIALKPHFILVWAARETLICSQRRSLTIEGVIIPLVGVAYLLSVVLITPQYFELVESLGHVYREYIRNPIWVTALVSDGAAITLGALLLSAALWRHTVNPNLRSVLITVVGAAYLAAVVQQKGWRYHFLPAITLGWILLGLSIWRLRRPLQLWTQRLFASIAIASFAGIAVASIAGALLQAANPLDSKYNADPDINRLLPFVSAHAAAHPVAVLSPNMASGFPLIEGAGARWVLRYSNFWPLVAAYDSALQAVGPLRLRALDEALPIENRLRSAIIEDLAAARPGILIVLRPGPDDPKWGMRRLDLIKFLSAEQGFADVFSGYTFRGTIGQYHIYSLSEYPVAIPAELENASANRSVAPNEVRIDPSAVANLVLLALAIAVLYRRESRFN